MDHSLPQERPFKETIQQFLFQNGCQPIRYGMGCAWLGRSKDYRANLKSDLLALETAYRLGFRYFDTAVAYGTSEFVVGEFVASVPRQSIFLATKFNLSPQQAPQEAGEHVRKSLAESLRRLKTDRLDLYQVHDVASLSNVLAMRGALEALVEAKRQGLIRYFGVATRWHNILEEAVRHGSFDTILTYSDYTPYRQTAAGVIALANQHDMGVINASPLAGIREQGLDIKDRDILATSLQFPLSNPGIDITLTGPANEQEVRLTVEALLQPRFNGN